MKEIVIILWVTTALIFGWYRWGVNSPPPPELQNEDVWDRYYEGLKGDRKLLVRVFVFTAIMTALYLIFLFAGREWESVWECVDLS